jgi:Skp family chaperone for outer membrane proteins
MTLRVAPVAILLCYLCRTLSAAEIPTPPLPDHTSSTNVIAALDVNAAFDNYYKTKMLGEQLKQEAEQYEVEAKKLQATKEGRRQLDDYVKFHRKLLDTKMAAMRASVVHDIWEVTGKLARELGYTMVIDSSGNFKGYFWAEKKGLPDQEKKPKPIDTKAPDITSDLINILVQKPASLQP